MSKKDSDDQKKSMSVMFRGRAIFKPLNTGRIDERAACVREYTPASGGPYCDCGCKKKGR